MLLNPKTTHGIDALFGFSQVQFGAINNRVGGLQDMSNPAEPAKLVDSGRFKRALDIRSFTCPCKIQIETYADGFGQAPVAKMPRKPMTLPTSRVKENSGKK